MMMMIGFLILVSPFIFSSCHFLLPMVLQIQGSSCFWQDSPLFSQPSLSLTFFLPKFWLRGPLSLLTRCSESTVWVWRRPFSPRLTFEAKFLDLRFSKFCTNQVKILSNSNRTLSALLESKRKPETHQVLDRLWCFSRVLSFFISCLILNWIFVETTSFYNCCILFFLVCESCSVSFLLIRFLVLGNLSLSTIFLSPFEE